MTKPYPRGTAAGVGQLASGQAVLRGPTSCTSFLGSPSKASCPSQGPSGALTVHYDVGTDLDSRCWSGGCSGGLICSLPPWSRMAPEVIVGAERGPVIFLCPWRQLLVAFQDTGCHSRSKPGQLDFWDLPGAWGRVTVPECLECDMWSGTSIQLTPRMEVWSVRLCFIWASAQTPGIFENVNAGKAPGVNESNLLIFQQEKQAQRGQGVAASALRGSVHIKSTHWSTGVDTSDRCSTHSSRTWACLVLEALVGGVRLAVMRKRNPGLLGPGRHGHGHFLQGGVPLVPGAGATGQNVLDLA